MTDFVPLPARDPLPSGAATRAGRVTATVTDAGELGVYGLASLPQRPAIVAGRVAMLPMSAPRWWLRQVGRALSRLLNALTGGEGDTTYSAASWAAKAAGEPLGAARVRFVDWLNGGKGHCFAAWVWHRDHGLLSDDVNDPD